MPVHNVTEQLVRELLKDNFVRNNRLTCSCENCQDDIVALALNALPSRYASSNVGEAYFKTQVLSSQVQSDIVRELTIAVGIVAQHPHHAGTAGKYENAAGIPEAAASVDTDENSLGES